MDNNSYNKKRKNAARAISLILVLAMLAGVFFYVIMLLSGK